MSDLLSVKGLTTHIFSDSGVVKAVNDVSLRVSARESVALVGESGCGKSMTALSLMRLVREPARTLQGEVTFNGQDILRTSEKEMRRIRGGDLAIIFQDPLTFLNPLMQAGLQIVEAILLHRDVGSKEAHEIAMEMLRLVRVPDPARVFSSYPHQLSGGMRQRVLIATALSSRPLLLIADEPSTALDVTIQAQIMRLLAALREELGSALLLITHDLGLVAEYCDRVYIMYAGEIVEEADVETIFCDPKHPYTKALLQSTLSIEKKTAQFRTIEGHPPNLASLPSGCSFHPRCPAAFDRCRVEAPPIVHEQSRWSRCWLQAPGGGGLS
jgi:oligopeptide/dipeptide ABC transporter ATP-binding protein